MNFEDDKACFFTCKIESQLSRVGLAWWLAWLVIFYFSSCSPNDCVVEQKTWGNFLAKTQGRADPANHSAYMIKGCDSTGSLDPASFS